MSEYYDAPLISPDDCPAISDGLLPYDRRLCISLVRQSITVPTSLIPCRFPGVYRLFAGLTPVMAAKLASFAG